MQGHSWRFNHLSAAQLLPVLQQHLLACNSKANWQLAWLNNDGKPIIALLPKVSWQLYATADSPSTYQVIQNYRHTDKATTSTLMSYEAWQQQLIRYSQSFEGKGYKDNEPVVLEKPNSNQPDYSHGLIGFIGYDVAARQLSPATNIQAAKQPLAVMGHYDIYLTAVTTNNRDSAQQLFWQLTIKDTGVTKETTDSEAAIADLIGYLQDLDNKISVTNYPKLPSALLAPLVLESQWSKNDYQQAFVQTQRYLQQGDCYQINLTQAWQGQLTTPVSCDDNPPASLNLIDYLPSLQRNTQAPFAGYIGVSAARSDNSTPLDFELLSCSPELFFTFTKDAESGHHSITTKPIKGTMPRGLTNAADEVFKQQLLASDKDRAENVMIVDLLRNDLGKYAQTGSVKVPKLFAIESFSNVHHMVSTISAKLKADTHPLSVLFGSLPAGSITGTPKKRAVEIISELEIAARGAYCGTMGYMNFDGSGQWNVLIRSLQATNLADGHKQVSLWAGGGITVASDVDAEYQECLDKVGNLLAVLAQADS